MKISRLCLGTMNFVRQSSKQGCFYLMDEGLDTGINFFDTADACGAGLEDRGGTEKIIGRWLSQGGGRRDAVIIAVKVFGDCAAFYDRYEENSATDGLSKYKILKHCEGTLTVYQLKENIKATEIMLSDATLKKLNEIFPRPGGKVPKAYAWQTATIQNYDELSTHQSLQVNPELQFAPARFSNN